MQFSVERKKNLRQTVLTKVAKHRKKHQRLKIQHLLHFHSTHSRLVRLKKAIALTMYSLVLREVSNYADHIYKWLGCIFLRKGCNTWYASTRSKWWNKNNRWYNRRFKHQCC